MRNRNRNISRELTENRNMLREINNVKLLLQENIGQLLEGIENGPDGNLF